MLFDEIEKAHPDVFNVLLQVLDDGRITDSQGRTIDFKNTVLILTSNLGSSYLLEGIDPDGNISQFAKDEINALLKQSFRPEFLNRLDEIIFYKPLTKDNMRGIIDIQLKRLAERLNDQELLISVSDNAKNYIIDKAYDPVYGARPLKRYIQSNLETKIAQVIISENILPSSLISVDVKDDELTVSVTPPDNR